MKKKLVLFISAVFALEALTGCQAKKHEHKFVDKFDATYHWTECECGEATEKIVHTLEGKYDDGGHWKECTCGYKTTKLNHTISHEHDEHEHWDECTCGYVSGKENHTCVTMHDNNYHWTQCDCGYRTENELHSLSWDCDETQHWQACECGYTLTKYNHSFTLKDDTALASAATCEDDATFYYTCECGAVSTNTYTKTGTKLGHDYDYKGDCKHAGCTKSIAEEVEFNTALTSNFYAYRIYENGTHILKINTPTTRFGVSSTTWGNAKFTISAEYDADGNKLFRNGEIDKPGVVYIHIYVTGLNNANDDRLWVGPGYTVGSAVAYYHNSQVTINGKTTGLFRVVSGALYKGQMQHLFDGTANAKVIKINRIYNDEQKELDSINVGPNDSGRLVYLELDNETFPYGSFATGMVISYSTSTQTSFTGNVYFYSAKEGGRHLAIEDLSGNYTGNVYAADRNGVNALSVGTCKISFSNAVGGKVSPGTSCFATITLQNGLVYPLGTMFTSERRIKIYESTTLVADGYANANYVANEAWPSYYGVTKTILRNRVFVTGNAVDGYTYYKDLSFTNKLASLKDATYVYFYGENINGGTEAGYEIISGKGAGFKFKLTEILSNTYDYYVGATNEALQNRLGMKTFTLLDANGVSNGEFVVTSAQLCTIDSENDGVMLIVRGVDDLIAVDTSAIMLS